MAKIKIPKSKEEVVADKIAELITDLRLDLEQVGIYLGRNQNIVYRRVQLVAESAKYEKEEAQQNVWG